MKKFAFMAAIVLLTAACSSPKTNTTMSTGGTSLASKDGDNGYMSLFDGKTLNGWRGYQSKATPAWEVLDGAIHCKGSTGNSDLHADLVTTDSFQNFDLSLDWKIAPKGNSGIMYLVQETSGPAYETGPEYQLIDDAGYPDKLEDWQKTGANYAMNPAPTAKPKPVGEWNTTRIVVNNGHVEHWLNGDKIVEYELGSEAWQKAKAEGKWKDTPGYGIHKSGRIALQDHGSEAWFKDIKIRRL